MNSIPRQSLEKIDLYLDVLLQGRKHELPPLSAEEATLLQAFLEQRQAYDSRPAFYQALKTRIQEQLVNKDLSADQQVPQPGKQRHVWTISRRAIHLFRLAAMVILVLGIGAYVVFAPEIKGVFKRQVVSAQTILTNAVNKLSTHSSQNIAIQHVVERITTCSSSAMPLEWQNAPPQVTAKGDETGDYHCQTSNNETWNFGEWSYTIASDQSGKVTDMMMHKDGWDWTYMGGAKKASKENTQLLYGDDLAANSSTMTNTSTPILYNTAQNAPASSAAQANAQIETNTLTKLKDLYGDVKVLGEEPVNAHQTYRLQYSYTSPPASDFGVAMNNIGGGTVSGTAGNPIGGRVSDNFWVDKNTFERVKYEEYVEIDGKQSLLYRSENLTSETIDKSEAGRVFQFRVPAGVEIVDLTSAYLAAQQHSLDNLKVAMLQLVTTAKTGVFVLGSVPKGLELQYVDYTDSEIGRPANQQDFMSPAMWQQMIDTANSQLGQLFSLNYSNYGSDPVASCAPPTVVQTLRFGASTIHSSHSLGLGTSTDAKSQSVLTKTVQVRGTTAKLMETAMATTDAAIDLSWEENGIYFDLVGTGLGEQDVLAAASQLVRLGPTDQAQILLLQQVADHQVALAKSISLPTIQQVLTAKQLPLMVPQQLPLGMAAQLTGVYCSGIGTLRSDYDLIPPTGIADAVYLSIEQTQTDPTQAILKSYGYDNLDKISSKTVKVGSSSAFLYPFTYPGQTKAVPHLVLVWKTTDGYIALTTVLAEADLLTVANHLRAVQATDTATLQPFQDQLNATQSGVINSSVKQAPVK